MLEMIHEILSEFSATALIIICGCAAVAGLVRGFAGFGTGMILGPGFSSVLVPSVSVPVICIIDSLVSLPVALTTWRKIDWRPLFLIVGSSIPAVVLGTHLLSVLDPTIMRTVMGISILCFAYLIAGGWQYRGDQSRFLVVCVGLVSGLFSGLMNTGAPPVLVFAFAISSDPREARAFIIGYFLLSTVVTFSIYWITGLFTLKVVAISALTIGPYLGAIGVGLLLFPLASALTYKRIALAIIVIMATMILVMTLKDCLTT